VSQKIIKYAEQDISDSDLESVLRTLKSEYLTQGPAILHFEGLIRDYCEVKYSYAVNSATSGLHLACLAIGVKAGDHVWTSANTFVATANAVRLCGADVDFIDICPKSLNMSLDLLEEKLKIETPPKAIIAVHFAGHSCDMARLRAITQPYGIRIIEDAAHAIGGGYEHKKIGDCRYSDVCVFSFHPVKIITAGEGGAVTTNDPELARTIRRLRSHGITSDPLELESVSGGELWTYQQFELGFNYRMTDIQAALGASQMTRLDAFVRRRHQIAEWYDQNLRELPLELPQRASNVFSSLHLYVIRLKLNEIEVDKKEFFFRMRNGGVLVNFHYIPVYRQPYYRNLGFRRGYCPEAEKYFLDAVSIPMHAKLSNEDLEYIKTSIESALVG